MPGPTRIAVPGRSDLPPRGWLPDSAAAGPQWTCRKALDMLLELVDVAKAYKGGLRGVDGVTMRLGAGLVGLLGPNGAGKATLMRIAATVPRPTGGQVLFDGTDVVARPDLLRRSLGYLPQDFGVYPHLTAR